MRAKVLTNCVSYQNGCVWSHNFPCVIWNKSGIRSIPQNKWESYPHNLIPFDSKEIKRVFAPLNFVFLCRCGQQKATPNITAVRETSVSRHHRGPIEGPPEPPRTSQHSIVLRGLRRALRCSPILPRDVSLSDSRCKFFKFG